MILEQKAGPLEWDFMGLLMSPGSKDLQAAKSWLANGRKLHLGRKYDLEATLYIWKNIGFRVKLKLGSKFFFFFFFLRFYLFEKEWEERMRENMSWERGRWRGKGMLPAGQGTWCWTRSQDLGQDHDLSQMQTLNWLSYPGMLKIIFWVDYWAFVSPFHEIV